MKKKLYVYMHINVRHACMHRAWSEAPLLISVAQHLLLII